MIESMYQASCDQCMDNGDDFEPRHSSQELGECTKADFKRFLRAIGWKLGRPGRDERDLCPKCKAALAGEERKS
jgi:hypothetical protein